MSRFVFASLAAACLVCPSCSFNSHLNGGGAAMRTSGWLSIPASSFYSSSSSSSYNLWGSKGFAPEGLPKDSGDKASSDSKNSNDSNSLSAPDFADMREQFITIQQPL
jgi:hypothetical protein